MYIYRVGYGTQEESHFDYLTHDVSFDEEEFTQAFLAGCVAVVRSWLSEPVSDQTFNLTTYADITKLASSWLVDNRGFSFINVQAEAVVGGWNPLTPRPFVDHSGAEGMSELFAEGYQEEVPIILNRLRDEGLTPLIDAKNKEIDDNLEVFMANWQAETERREKEDNSR